MATATKKMLPKAQLVETDGEPLETPWHFAAIALLIDSIRFHFRLRTDYFVGGNMFLYYSTIQARNRDYRGPDFFYVDEVDGLRTRQWWAVWEEDGRYPDVITELLSSSTADLDRTVKKRLYEQTFRTFEYFCYEPTGEKLEGWRLGRRGRYQAIRPDRRGWLWCEKLRLWIGLWTGKHMGVQGVFPRFFNVQGQLIPTAAEAAREWAELEKERADQAEAQLAALKAKMARLERPKSHKRNGDA
jgi:hypothetical protein